MSKSKFEKLAEDLRTGNVTIEDVDLDAEEFYVDGERLAEERADQLTADVLAKVRSRDPAHRRGSRQSGTNPRALGANPRAIGTNPRALGTNPRAQQTDEATTPVVDLD